ncbi:hypothetical protein Tco_1128207 [Tanacetum coccineum]
MKSKRLTLFNVSSAGFPSSYENHRFTRMFWAISTSAFFGSSSRELESDCPATDIKTNSEVERSQIQCLVSVRMKQIRLKDSVLEWLGRVVHCITGSMMSIFNVSNHLSDSGSICIDPVSA